VQFITTTHSPIVARSVGSLDERLDADNLIHLTLAAENDVHVESVPKMKGLRSDQVLASEAFGYLVDASPEAMVLVRRASELAAKGTRRTTREESEYGRLQRQLPGVVLGQAQSQAERETRGARLSEIDESIRELESRIFGDELDKD